MYASEREQLVSRQVPVAPHAAKALSPIQETSLEARVALRLYAERKTPLPSSWVNFDSVTLHSSVPGQGWGWG